MTKYIKFVVGIALGFLIAGAIWVLYLVSFSAENSSKARVDFALKELDKEQRRLGIQCVDGDKLILSYIDAVAPVVEKLANGQRLSESDPIIAKGEKVSDVMATCGLLKSMLEADNIRILSNLALGDDLVRQEISLIRLAMSRTTATWCDSECIQDARKEILAKSLLMRQRLLSKPN